FFVDDSTLLISSNDVAEAIATGKIKFGKAPEAYHAVAAQNKSFIGIRFTIMDTLDREALLSELPETVTSHLKNLVFALFVPENNRIDLTAGFVNPENASFIGSSLEAFRSHALLEANARLSQAEAECEKMTFAELFQGSAGQIITAAAGKDFLSCLKFNSEGLNLQASAVIPPSLRGSALLVIAATIALPNFKIAREQARTKACFANQRVILGAVEMYNMDNQVMLTELKDADTRNGGLLVSKGYLKTGVISPEPDCSYHSIGDLSGTGLITCTRHGSVAGY
ncbi:MAG: hypothetical protein PHD82_14385, partial [Candidatus Riflebacteria bacterium]|nr:hypothetical protein [Candidatus Riflebacteria bacterium]